MAANMGTLQRLQRALTQLQSVFLRLTGVQSTHEPYKYNPNIDMIFSMMKVDFELVPAFDGIPVDEPDSDNQLSEKPSLLEELIGNGILWAKGATQKRRRSREKSQTRRFGSSYMMKKRILHPDIVSCLECGTYHKRNTLCGECYKRVQGETFRLIKKMRGEPLQEMVIRYRGDKGATKFRGKYVIEEWKRPRPAWFPDLEKSSK